MIGYTHLTQEERYQIYALMKAGHKQDDIAAIIGRSPSTVSRELCRTRPRITDRARFEGTRAISHESIYQFVYAEKRSGGELWHHLRCQKPYRKRYGSGRGRRGQIPAWVSIAQRPAAVEHREGIGHWEADTVHGRRRRGAVLSLAERCSRLTRLAKLPRVSAKAVRDGARRRLQPIADTVDSLTAEPISTSPIPTPPGSVGPTRTPTGSFVSIFPNHAI